MDALAIYKEKPPADGGAHSSGFDPDRPWDFVFQKVVDDTDWWEKELKYPALLLISTGARLGDVLGGDALVSGKIPATSPPGLDVYHTEVPDTVGVSQAPPRVQRGARPAAAPPPPRAGKKAKQHNVPPSGVRRKGPLNGGQT